MKIISILILIFLFGCEDKTYKQIYDKSKIDSKITYISLSNIDKNLRKMALRSIKDEGFGIKTQSPYSIYIESRRYSHHCNNPNTIAYDATYDGFVKLTLSYKMKKVYSIQRDYHGKLDEDIISSLLEEMKRDLKLHE